jgi:hypothetical protein
MVEDRADRHLRLRSNAFTVKWNVRKAGGDISSGLLAWPALLQATVRLQ